MWKASSSELANISSTSTTANGGGSVGGSALSLGYISSLPSRKEVNGAHPPNLDASRSGQPLNDDDNYNAMLSWRAYPERLVIAEQEQSRGDGIRKVMLSHQPTPTKTNGELLSE